VQLPHSLIESLEGTKGFDKDAFVNVHTHPESITSIRINPLKWSMQQAGAYSRLAAPGLVPWSQHGYYLKERPSFTFDPLFHAGCYYVQEASSMFLEQVLKQTVDLSKPIKVLDLCAAPGGKSTHIQSLMSKESILVSNDVIKSRANILKDNVIKWGSDNVVVTNNDPKDFSRLENYFDVIVIDAPCSGSGLFRRDEEAINEWSENNVALCSQRQQRILADTWPALKKDGILIYSTCSYSREEDEEILDWIGEQFAVSSLQLAVKQDWNITEVESETGMHGYRFWPYQLKGEGFFISCFKKEDGGGYFPGKAKKTLAVAGKKEQDLVSPWLKENTFRIGINNNLIYALPVQLADEINILLSCLRVQYSGTIVGEIFGDKFVPSHPLAMSPAVSDNIPRTELDYEKAIQYLQKKEFNPGVTTTGWHLITYQGHNLGWAKMLSSRINNYYPKELRILKEI
jgi:NOL1/NOP2/sun family putative RNA methylase